MALTFKNTNIRFHSKVEAKDAELRQTKENSNGLGISTMLCSTIEKLASDKPLWDFVATGYDGCYERVSTFKVYKDGEELGEIGHERHSRNYNLYVKNKRISAKMSRTDRYRTSDVDKAVLKVKKMFGVLSTSERIAESAGKAAHVLSGVYNSKWSELRSNNSKIERIAEQYVMKDGFNTFVEWLKTQVAKQYRDTLEGIDNKVRLETEMLTIEKARDHFNEGKAMLVIKDDGKYILKVGDKVDLYDDTSLPQEVRGKLGMLKLVEAEQFLTNIGCRINDETFVLILEEVKDEG